MSTGGRYGILDTKDRQIAIGGRIEMSPIRCQFDRMVEALSGIGSASAELGATEYGLESDSVVWISDTVHQSRSN
jgi:hypothetical protein